MTADDRTAADRRFALDVLDRVMAPQLALGEALKVAAAVLSTAAARATFDAGAQGPVSATPPWNRAGGAGSLDRGDPDPLDPEFCGTDMGPQVGWLVQAHNTVVGWLPFNSIVPVALDQVRRVLQDPNLDYARVIPVYADGSTSTLHARDLS